MIDIVDKALEQHQCVDPTLYVDDVSAELVGPDDWIEVNLVDSVSLRRRSGSRNGDLGDQIRLHSLKPQLDASDHGAAKRIPHSTSHSDQIAGIWDGGWRPPECHCHQQAAEGIQKATAEIPNATAGRRGH